MKKIKNVKRINLKIPFIIMCIIALVGFAVGGVYAYFGEGSYKEENSKVLNVTSADVIQKRGKYIANDRIQLANDIHVTDESFCVGDSNTAFVGTFDGCGHTVYLDYAVGKSTSTFFASIGEKGVVKNTRFVFTNVAIESNSFSGVVNINYGTIQDCMVEYKLQFNAKDGMFTPFAGVNCGVIKNIVTKGTFRYNPNLELPTEPDESEQTPTTPDESGEQEEGVEPSDTESGEESENAQDENAGSESGEEENGGNEGEEDNEENPEIPENPVEEEDETPGSIHSEEKNDDEKKIAFAGVCVYNYGELKNVLSTPRFVGFYCTLRDNYLAGKSDNVSIASVCAFSGDTNSSGTVATEKGLVSICEKTLYTSDDVRLDKFEDFASLIYDATGSISKTTIENTYDFNNTVWEIDETALCLKLKIK